MRFFRRKKQFFTKTLISFLLVPIVILSLAPSVSAQAVPNQNNKDIQNKQELIQPGEQIKPGRAVTPATNSALAGETGEVLQVSISCPIGFSILGFSVEFDVCSILEKVINFFIGFLGKIVVKIIFWILRIFAAVFGFALDKISALCGNQEGLDGLISEIDDGAINPELVRTFNIFVVADMGVSGVYDSIPKDTPVTYLASTFRNNIFGVTPTFAQGVGTSSLGETTLQVWEKMRDLSMILMVLVLVAIGFMIMFRRKLSPQTSVTVLNSLPRVALALVLITFSYAISGLFIDLAYVGVNLVRSYFGSLGVYQTVFGAVSQRMGGELIWFPIFTAFSFGTIFNWAAVLCAFLGVVVAAALIPPLAVLGLTAAPFAFMIFMIGVLLVEVLMRLTLFGLAVFVFWQLLKTFVVMIVYTIFSPMFFLMGALPGFEGTTINWFKRMLANAITFPVILVFLFIALTFIWGSNPVFQVLTGTIQAPPPLGSNLLNIGYLVGMGITFFASKVPKVIEKMMKLDDFDIKGGVGGGLLLAPITAPGRALGMAGSAGKTLSGLTSGYGNIKQGTQLLRGVGWNPRGPEQPANHPFLPGASIEPAQTAKTGRIARAAQAAYRRAPGFLRNDPDNAPQGALYNQEDHPDQPVLYGPSAPAGGAGAAGAGGAGPAGGAPGAGGGAAPGGAGGGAPGPTFPRRRGPRRGP